MLNNAKAILDFEDSEELKDLDEKLIDAIKNHKKIYPVDVSIIAEYDEVSLILSIRDKDNNSYNVGNLSFSSNDFHSLMGDAGYTPNLSDYDKMSEQEKKELEKDA